MAAIHTNTGNSAHPAAANSAQSLVNTHAINASNRRNTATLRSARFGARPHGRLARPVDKEGPLLIELATAVHQAANTCTATAAPAACQPSWLDTGSNSWQLTAATFVGLMSVPGLALLYGGLVPKKWVVNTMFMAFSGFSAVLIVWVLWAYKMGFGAPVGGGTANTWSYTYGSNFFKNFFYNFVGHPETSLRGTSQISQAKLDANGGTSLPLSQADRGAVLLPVRVRCDHAVAVPRQRARPHQGQGVDHLRPALDDLRLRRQRDADLGWRLLGARRRRRLLRWLRHPLGCRHQRIRRCLGDRPAPRARPREVRAAQPAAGLDRRRHHLARLERLQRW